MAVALRCKRCASVLDAQRDRDVKELVQARLRRAREKLADPKSGLSNTYKRLREAPAQTLVMMRRVDGTYTSDPVELDRMLREGWKDIFEGGDPDR
eukprot:2118568-Alexandrium_andersonii.AAC.1